jgi:hypothetical protein
MIASVIGHCALLVAIIIFNPSRGMLRGTPDIMNSICLNNADRRGRRHRRKRCLNRRKKQLLRKEGAGQERARRR